MLAHLTVQNFALIDNVELSFTDGLTVITGETGSGKSILLGALHLLLGERADYSLLRNADQKTIVEGTWDISSYNLANYFTENELDFDDTCIIRREILPQGKSRAFINDTPVSLAILKGLTEQLIQINSQHHTLELKDKAFQLSLLDYLGGNITLLQEYQSVYDNYIKANKNFLQAKEALSSAVQERDYKQFQLDEIFLLNLATTNFDELTEELEKTEHSEDLINVLGQVISYFDSEEIGLAQLKKSTNSLSKIAHFSSKIGEWETRMKSQLLELEDIHQEIAQFVDSIEINPEKLLLLTEKVDNFKRIAKKHNLDTQEELLQFQKSLENDLSNTDELENDLIQLEKQKDTAWEKVIQLSAKLSEVRKKSIPTIVQEMKPLLAELKLPDSQIDFKLTPKAIPDRKGMETVDLLFSPNKGIAPQMIEKSASGGELGRFMLVVQTLLSEKKQLPSIVFDEIDTGVSGDVADRLGKMLRKMGAKRQLFAITHLPQVAASGNHHIKVSKLADKTSTVTKVEKLNQEQRIVEIAQLMSGEKINDAALENARLLINEQ